MRDQECLADCTLPPRNVVNGGSSSAALMIERHTSRQAMSDSNRHSISGTRTDEKEAKCVTNDA